MQESYEEYHENYYEENNQDGDRLALLFYQRLVRRFSKGSDVLDFGCGAGFLSRRLAKSGLDVTSLETNLYAHDLIIKNSPSSLIVEQTEDVLNDSQDMIVALHVLEHITDDVLIKLGAEFRRVLRDGSKCLFVMPNPSGKAATLRGPDWMGFRDPTHVNMKSPDEWEKFFEQEWNMRTLACFSDGYYDGRYRNLTPLGIAKDTAAYARTVLQFIAARPMLGPNDGEATIYLIELV